MNYVGLAKPPDSPHLCLGPDPDGMSIALPAGKPGTALQLVTNPARPDGVQPLGLQEVWAQGMRAKLVFYCGCGKAGCTRVLKLKGTWEGRHPSSDEAANEALARKALGGK